MNKPAVQVAAAVALESLALRCETVREGVDSRWTKRIVCWRPVATRPVGGMSLLLWGETPPLREIGVELVPSPTTVDGDTYVPIFFELLEVSDAWLEMLLWVTKGGVGAEVRHALEVGTMSEKDGRTPTATRRSAAPSPSNVPPSPPSASHRSSRLHCSTWHSERRGRRGGSPYAFGPATPNTAIRAPTKPR